MPTPIHRQLALTGSAQALGTVPADKFWVIRNIRATNVHALDAAQIRVWRTDDSDGDAVSRLAYDAAVAVSDALIVAEDLHLDAGDAIWAMADGPDLVEIELNAMEFDVPA